MIYSLPRRFLWWVPVIFVSQVFAFDCIAQVVQLPSMHTFSYSGTVSAPDAGIDYLAGVQNSSQGSATRGWGPYAGRAAGSAISGGQLSLSAMIIDLKAMDDAILGTTSPAVPVQGAKTTGPNPMSAQPFGYARTSRPPVDPNGWQLALSSNTTNVSSLRDDQASADVRYYLDKAEESMRANRLAAARVFRRMAFERMTPELRNKMEERAKAIRAASAGNPVDSKQVGVAKPQSGPTKPLDNGVAPDTRRF